MRPDVRIRLVVLAAGLAFGAVVTWLTLASDAEANLVWEAVRGLVVGLAWIVSGLVAWGQRPGSRIGPLMTLVGFAWFLGQLAFAPYSIPATAGAFASALYIGVFAHVVVSFPTGRLTTALARWLVILVYVDVTAVKALSHLFDAEFCDGCAPNAALVQENETLDVAFANLSRGAGAALSLLGIWVLVQNWRRASPALRRAIAPVLWSGALAVAAGFVALVNESLGAPAASSALLFCVTFTIVPVAFLAGVVRSRLSRAAVAGLVVELGSPQAAGSLRDALARALHDPSVELAYWREETGGYVDLDGHAFVLPDGAPNRAATIVERAGRPVAAIVHDPSLADEPELVQAACAAAGLALENERLAADLRARVDELRASRARIVEATDAARRRVERNLHDGAQQRLVSISLALGLAESRLPADPDGARALVTEARASLGVALRELRELSQGIHPAILSERGLAAALRELSYSAPIPVELDVALDGRLPEPVEAAAYYLVAEALANVGKHAHASTARVEVLRAEGAAAVRVADDGVGGADPTGGSGLRGLADRVEALGGRLAVTSAPGRGTELTAVIPCG